MFILSELRACKSPINLLAANKFKHSKARFVQNPPRLGFLWKLGKSTIEMFKFSKFLESSVFFDRFLVFSTKKALSFQLILSISQSKTIEYNALANSFNLFSTWLLC